ncbi:hypothetical protein PV772_12830 [Pseudarthrobacter sp. CC12]|uniref:hypothetical protein n=1 Tax=Pseudarthrobacter sp. CC12 TaxID=3029193 RepID=UPI0032634CD4
MIALFAVVCAWAIAILLTGQFLPQIVADLSAAATDSGTYDARVRSWINLINQSTDSGLSGIIFGQPMGIGFGRFEGVGRWVEFAPHNWYVTMYLRVGVLGLGMLIVFLLGVAARVLSNRRNMAALAVVVAVLVYGWSYSWPWYICLFFGWAVCQYRDQPTVQDVSVTVPRAPKIRITHLQERRWQT